MALINPFGKSYTDKELQMFSFLKNIALFSDLNNKELIHFLPYLFERDYDQSEVVFFRDDPAHALYIIKVGVVSLNIDIEDKVEELTEISDNQIFGENCLMESSKRRVNAIVKSEKATMYVIPRDNLMNIMSQHKSLSVKIMTRLAQYYEQMLKRLFRNYRSSFGLFNLGDIFKRK